MKRIESVNLFGDPVVIEVSQARRPEIPKGYAAIPGTGPEGEKCRTCRHAVKRSGNARDYWKCSLMKARWTGGYGSDIRLKSPACSKWERKAAMKETK